MLTEHLSFAVSPTCNCRVTLDSNNIVIDNSIDSCFLQKEDRE